MHFYELSACVPESSRHRLQTRQHSPNHLAFRLFSLPWLTISFQFNGSLNYSCQSPSIQQPLKQGSAGHEWLFASRLLIGLLSGVDITPTRRLTGWRGSHVVLRCSRDTSLMSVLQQIHSNLMDICASASLQPKNTLFAHYMHITVSCYTAWIITQLWKLRQLSLNIIHLYISYYDHTCS